MNPLGDLFGKGGNPFGDLFGEGGNPLGDPFGEGGNPFGDLFGGEGNPFNSASVQMTSKEPPNVDILRGSSDCYTTPTCDPFSGVFGNQVPVSTCCLILPGGYYISNASGQCRQW